MLTVFYDGGCALCHFWVRFLIHRDTAGKNFLFAPLGGGRFQRTFSAEVISTLPDSIIVVDEAGATHIKSAAVAVAVERLGGFWSLCARILRLIPRALADIGYDLVAKTRIRVFGRTKSSCPFMDADTQKRFDL